MTFRLFKITPAGDKTVPCGFPVLIPNKLLFTVRALKKQYKKEEAFEQAGVLEKQ